MKLTPIDGLIRVMHDNDSGSIVLTHADAKDLVKQLNALLPSDLLEESIALLKRMEIELERKMEADLER